ncbi:MAG: hypothetical protein ACJ76S_12695 [Solirubrobacteraceae bacterium]|jgi:hypothetical protein
MSRIRARLTYANVAATLALFVALGSGSYAVSAVPASNSAPCCTQRDGATFLRFNSIRSPNIVNGQVMTADIGTDQVLSSDIRDGTISLADLSPEVVARLKKAASEKNKDNQGTSTTPAGGQPGTTTPTTTTTTTTSQSAP